MYLNILFRLCSKDKNLKFFVCTNIYFTPMYIYGPLHMAEQKQGGQLEPT